MVGPIAKWRPWSVPGRVFMDRGELLLIFGKLAASGAAGNGGCVASGRKNQEATEAHWNNKNEYNTKLTKEVSSLDKKIKTVSSNLSMQNRAIFLFPAASEEWNRKRKKVMKRTVKNGEELKEWKTKTRKEKAEKRGKGGRGCHLGGAWAGRLIKFANH